VDGCRAARQGWLSQRGVRRGRLLEEVHHMDTVLAGIALVVVVDSEVEFGGGGAEDGGVAGRKRRSVLLTSCTRGTLVLTNT